MFDSRLVFRWMHLGRISLAAALFLAAMAGFQEADARLAGVAIVLGAAVAFTVASVWYRMRRGGVPSLAFRATHLILDLALVTASVHLTGGALSPFAALYILVIAAAALLVRPGGTLAVAGGAIAMYCADVLVVQRTSMSLGVALQMGALAVVALGVAYLSGRLQREGESRDVIEAQLKLARLQAEDILGAIRSGIVTMNADGLIVFANPSARSLLGAGGAPLAGRQSAEAIRPRAPELAAALERAVRGGERVTRGEATITLADRAFPIGFTTTIIGDDGAGAASVTAIFQDISDSKRLEDLRLRAERLEAVAELSASLAHEIKNPLASIRSAVEQLAGAPRATDDERTLGRLIVRESDRLTRLLSEFLNFARVRATRGGRVDVTGIARAAAHLAATHPERPGGLRVSCDAPDAPVLVEGDEDLLHRAVFNVVLNAAQASPEHGLVTIEVSEPPRHLVPVGIPFQETAVMLRVTDEGPGIPLEYRDRIFDPFFTTRAGGTGLGLPIVQRAIEAHRGVVLVDSDARGTRFTILLPRYRAATREAA